MGMKSYAIFIFRSCKEAKLMYPRQSVLIACLSVFLYEVISLCDCGEV